MSMSTAIDETHAAGRPLDVAQVIRDGGGTAPVELTVASKLRDRGHRVTLYGPPEVRDHADAAGFDLEPLDWPPEPAARTGEDLIPRMIGTSVAWAERLASRFGDDDVDLVVADCTVFGALMAARLAEVPCVAVMPTVHVAGDPSRAAEAHLRGDPASALAGINRARAVLGLPAVASLTEQILDADRLLVLTSRAFELPEIQPPDHVGYVGPQLPGADHASGWRPPEGDEPLILVSLSTTDQGQGDLLERLLAAIAPLPVRALVTLGQAGDADRLRPPANVVLERFVPHAAVLPHAGLVVTHAGHGTVLAAVTRHGLGVRVEPGARVEDLRSAIRRVLDEPGYRRAAREMADAVEPASRVVEEAEEVLAGERSGCA